MNWRRWTLLILTGIAALLLLAWLARARIAAEFAQSYFRQHGVASSVEIGDLGLSGVSGRFALGPADAPEISAEHIELHFDPLGWIPRVVEVRLVNPVIRASIDGQGRATLPSLQQWLDTLQTGEKSRFVSDDLAVSLTGLRALLATPGGAVELDGDVKLVKNLPVAIALKARPATITYQGHVVTVRAAALDYDSASGRAAAHLSGALRDAAFDVQGLEAGLAADSLHWASTEKGLSVTTPLLHLQFAAASVKAGTMLTTPRLDLTAHDVAVSMVGGVPEGGADLSLTASVRTGLRIATGDIVLDRAIAANLTHLDVALAAHVERHGGTTQAALTIPLQVSGARGATLKIPTLTLAGTADALRIATDATLSGAGLPHLKLSSRNLLWSGGGFTGDLALAAGFDYAVLRGADIATRGTISWQSGSFAFTQAGCAKTTLVSFRPGATALAENIHANLCPAAGKPLIAGYAQAWTFTGQARAASAALPPFTVRLDDGEALLSFTGHGAVPQGTVTLGNAQISDALPALRFKPVLGSGTITLRDNVWRGRLAVTDPKKQPLADVTLTHAMATASGTAHISATKLDFAPDKLQPVDLSPLLAAFRQTHGGAKFEGDVDWQGSAITSHGNLAIAGLDFLTPLGVAHAVNTEIAFTSLLPPVSAAHQKLAIARIDWTLPFSSVDLRFGFSPTAIDVDGIHTGFAEGQVALGAFTINPTHPGSIQGTADINSITLSSLITASNLGERVKLEGKVSGHIPFTAGPEGMRVANGHLASDGPGRLSINRTLWTQGGPAANAVQDFAYQALENLAFDQMTADLNSIPGGRLQVVFHIKGHSDPPKPQTAEIALTDIINGKALQQTIPLPSATPIDLTLDTSLNFDELLKSYTEAWSKSLNPGAGANQ